MNVGLNSIMKWSMKTFFFLTRNEKAQEKRIQIIN